MTDTSALLVGLGLGIRHATDADHLAVVTALARHEQSRLQAIRIAALWSLGHVGSFLSIGLLVVILDMQLPRAVERALDLLVAAMVFTLGAIQLTARPANQGSVRARPVIIGLVHGLAGSAGIALLVATTTGSRLAAALYLALFSGGTVLGMAAMAAVISFPIRWSHQQPDHVRRWLFRLPGALSVAVGIGLLVDVLSTP